MISADDIIRREPSARRCRSGSPWHSAQNFDDLCGAISGSADYLLTGDKRDVGHLFGKTVRGVKIVNVQLLLAELIAHGIVDDG